MSAIISVESIIRVKICGTIKKERKKIGRRAASVMKKPAFKNAFR